MPLDGEGEQAALDDVDLSGFARELRLMNSEFNRVAHDFARSRGLHPTDVQALIAIMDAPTSQGSAMTPSALCHHLQLTSGAVSACLDRLERAGHVRRSRDTQDRRVVHLDHSPAATAVARAFFHPLADSTRVVLEGLSGDERRTVLGFLHALNQELATRRTEDPRP
ncbi:MarR family winged helix-turn-helix transcriptional regulator [Streptomyces odontomachi]|uniref:MarR family winged helix-turn-helix transcriptional regulator n=1 Tax=Streptomyces odontomachi TaxID=2944940 RepID=UPI00210AF836|nr:MarR family winged helix-turn-helix transcriptional regulator [Streptomyces sp. ODS25]